jgi:hypothetical protein
MIIPKRVVFKATTLPYNNNDRSLSRLYYFLITASFSTSSNLSCWPSGKYSANKNKGVPVLFIIVYSCYQTKRDASTDVGVLVSNFQANKAITLILDFHRETNFRFYFLSFLVLGFLHGVRGEFTDDVSETAVGPISWPVNMERTAVSETSSVNLPRTPCNPLPTQKKKHKANTVHTANHEHVPTKYVLPYIHTHTHKVWILNVRVFVISIASCYMQYCLAVVFRKPYNSAFPIFRQRHSLAGRTA